MFRAGALAFVSTLLVTAPAAQAYLVPPAPDLFEFSVYEFEFICRLPDTKGIIKNCVLLGHGGSVLIEIKPWDDSFHYTLSYFCPIAPAEDRFRYGKVQSGPLEDTQLVRDFADLRRINASRNCSEHPQEADPGPLFMKRLQAAVAILETFRRAQMRE